MGNTSSSLLRVVFFALGFTILNMGDGLLGGGGVTPSDFAWSFLGGLILALQLAWILQQIRLKRPDLIAVTWLALFVIFALNNLVEGYFFTEIFTSASVFAGAVSISLLTTLGYSVLAGVLFLSENPEVSIVSEFRSFIGERAIASWALRIVVASIVYFPIYFAFGALISPFIIQYYTDPSMGLKVPPFTVMNPLEFLRGFLYVVALLPIFASFKGSRRTLYAVIASLLYVPGGFVPLIIQPSLPANIVPFHMVEILADSVVYGVVLTRLLGRKPM